MQQGVQEFWMVYEIQLQKENDNIDLNLTDEVKKTEENLLPKKEKGEDKIKYWKIKINKKQIINKKSIKNIFIFFFNYNIYQNMGKNIIE